MELLQISDTHNRHQYLTNLPEADVIVHCGDFTDFGTEQEVLDLKNSSPKLQHRQRGCVNPS